MTLEHDDHWNDGERAPATMSIGRWTFKIDAGSIGDIAYDGAPVLRALRFVVRDHDWRTIPVLVDAVDASGDGVVVRAHHDELGVALHWTASLTATEATLRFDVEATATRDFRRNRLGIIALHSPDLAGTPFEISHPSGDTEATAFPEHISPHQPAMDIAGLAWETDGLTARLEFDGDVFEMEDQRNWTDASFKTYSTPLAAGFPVHVGAGTTVQQSATLSVGRRSGGLGGRERAPIVRPEGAGSGSWAPALSIGAATAPGVSQPSPPWMRGMTTLVELDATGSAWSRELGRARIDSAGGPLDVRIVATEPLQLDAVAQSLCGIPVVRLGVYDAVTHVTTPELHERLVSLAAAERLTGDLVGGTRAHFTELNRTHERLPAALGALTFSITPQMHDTSRRQVIESLGMQRLVALEAVRIAAGRPVHVGPVTLRARFNAVATSPRTADGAGPHGADISADGYGAARVWNATDPRQQGEAYAAWLVASYAALAVDGVESVAFAEAWGPRGFGTSTGVPDPSVSALRALVSVAGRPLVDIGVEYDPLAPVLAVAGPDGLAVIAANLTASPVSVAVGDVALTVAPASFAAVGF